MSRPIIFDFDGVIVDSEIIANTILAGTLTEFGFPTSMEDSLALYAGLRASDYRQKIEMLHEKKLPPEFGIVLQQRIAQQFQTTLRPVPGALEFIAECNPGRIAIASSSAPSRIKGSLLTVGLTHQFNGRIASASDLEKGKPHPEVFFLAAKLMGVPPRSCIVIEDGEAGIRGALAAGMIALGLTAGSHCRPGYHERLIAAGAHFVAASFTQIREFLSRT